MPTPQINLTATLDDLLGNAAGTTANPARLQIALCGFGLELPRIAGTSMLAKIGPFEVSSIGAAIAETLWGNDQITPAGTYYAISVIDGEGNIVQCAPYRFTGTQTIDLSNAIPLLPGFTTQIGAVPNGAFPGSLYQLPIPAYAAGAALCFYNGVLQNLDDFTLSGSTLSLSFVTGAGDALFVLYSAAGAGQGLPYRSFLAIGNGQLPGNAFTLPTTPPSAQFAGLFYNGVLLLPADYTMIGQNVILNFAAADGDSIFALYVIGPPITAAVPAGAIPGTAYLLPTTPTAGIVGLYRNGLFLRPEIDYTLVANAITLTNPTAAGDSLYAYYL
jgi:hypothetical protein